jgi:localization factor PodJL
MKSGAPWRLGGRRPEGREGRSEIARAVARRSGTSVGEWLNRVIAAADDEDEERPPPRDAAPDPPRRRWRQVSLTRLRASEHDGDLRATPRAAKSRQTKPQ